MLRASEMHNMARPARLLNLTITKKRFKLQTKTKRKDGMRKMQKRMRRMKTIMEELRQEQNDIGARQKQIREKFEAVESECVQLKKDSELIIQQSARTRIKLAIMFRILKAREDSDFSTAGNLTHLLRQIIAREEDERQGSV